jgi:acyl dehydratase
MFVAPLVIDLARVSDLVGRELASPWLDVSQETIAQFADVTSDRQWIHVDPERAGIEGPFGTTVAHGFLTLSLVSRLMRDALRFEPAPRLAINYGLNRVRFPSPVPANSRLRGRFTLLRLEQTSDGGHQATWSATIECEGSAKPSCVAEWLVRYYP